MEKISREKINYEEFLSIYNNLIKGYAISYYRRNKRIFNFKCYDVNDIIQDVKLYLFKHFQKIENQLYEVDDEKISKRIISRFIINYLNSTVYKINKKIEKFKDFELVYDLSTNRYQEIIKNKYKEILDKIVRFRLEGKTIRDIASIFNVPKSTIHEIIIKNIGKINN